LGTPPDFKLPLTGDAGAGQNGRITFNESAIADPYAGLPGFNPQVTVEPDFQADMLRGNWESTPVSNGFFSSANVDRIQQLIRKGVYDRSGTKQYVIDSQSADELKIIMRALYLESAINLPTNIREQVTALNQHVVNHCVPKLINEIRAYLKYKRDASNMYTIMTWPTYDNVKGKTLEMKPWF